MIPLVCKVRVRRRDGSRLRIWIPLFVLWPFILVLFVALELMVLMACVVLLFIWPRTAVTIALALPAALYLLFQLSGTSLELGRPGHSEVLVSMS
jgi:hypothetical protein